MRRLLVLAGAMLLAVVLLQCKKKQDVEADKTAVRQLVARDTTWFNANTTTDSTTESTYVQLGVDTLMVWWRGPQTHNQPTVNVNVVGDSAFVDWSRNNFGDLNILIKVPDTSLQLWVKKVAETARVRGIYLRSGNSDDSTRGWDLKAISLASGKSDSTRNVLIDSMRIQSQSQPNLLITDPLNRFFKIESLPWFRPAEPVTITLYTNTAAGDAFLHTFVLHWPFYVRLKFANQENGVYTGSWPTQIIPSPRFCIFDLMDHRTLFTPDYGYDFNGWLFPYWIRSE